MKKLLFASLLLFLVAGCSKEESNPDWELTKSVYQITQKTQGYTTQLVSMWRDTLRNKSEEEAQLEVTKFIGRTTSSNEFRCTKRKL